MSKPRYKWWSYVRWMIRLYPERVAELHRRQDARIIARYGPQAGGGSGPNRSTEDLGTVSLGRHVDREIEAVRLAIEDVRRMPDADARLRQIELYHWKRTHTLDGASIAVGVSERTGQTWNADFIYAVAAHFDLVDLRPAATKPAYDDSVKN